MPERYDTNKWKESSTKNLFIWQYFMGGHELAGWQLKEVRPWEVKTEKVVQYYWENTTDKEEKIKIDIIECQSWVHAQQQLLELLRQHMQIYLPEASKKEIRVGDAAYTGDGQEPQHLLFVRANVIAVLNSIGRKKVPVAKAALQLDNLFYDKPLLQITGVSPVIESFFLDRQDRKINEQDAVQVVIKATDPLRRPLWYKLMATQGEMLVQDNRLHLLPVPGEPAQLTLYTSNENGDTAEKIIDL
jgi:hypothetical protein